MFRKGLTNTVCIFGKYAKNNLPVALGPINNTNDHLQSVRYIKKHWDPKFKKYRKEKVIKVELPEDGEMSRKNDTDLSLARKYLRKMGLLPVHVRSERPIFLYSSLTIADPYEIPKGDGKFSDVFMKAPQKAVGGFKMKGKNLSALRKIKMADSTYKKEDFLVIVQDIYIKAHEALASNHDDLLQYVTEHAYPKMILNAKDKTIRWKFIESLEPPQIVQARHIAMTDDMAFGQITVRFNTQQMLAVYDRFGRLMQGSEILRKDVLEYVVFERSLSDMNPSWRLHAKILPSDTDAVHGTVEKTYVKPKSDVNDADVDLQLNADEKKIFEVLSKY